MEPLKPYLIRATYEWIVDNRCTPYLLVDADGAGVQVPKAYVEQGRIVLNLRPEAIQALEMDNDEVRFSARFGGTPQRVCVPIASVLALYARENGRGMVFEEDSSGAVEASEASHPPEPPEPPRPEPRGRPTLKVVK